ncbi:MAG: LD-carboxypeptidase [Bacteroidia bacterium]|nr:LD-carboxypeptidase [Bacteroidia bacterium]
MLIPPFLKKGDKIAIVSPAGKTEPSYITNAKILLEKLGYEVFLGKNVHSSYFQFAGTDSQRAADMQQMLDDASIKAILCSRGGYGTIRIIESLDFKKFRKAPKWIIGYSDITVLHTYLNKYTGCLSIHGTMPKNFPKDLTINTSIESLHRILTGQTAYYEIQPHPLNRTGYAQGIIIGGNLSLLYSLNGTKYFPDTKDKILFIEDTGEYLYHLDRMMMNLKTGGKLDHLNGLIIGGMTDMKDNETPFGKNAEQIIADIVKEYKYPVCFGFPAGHCDTNLSFILGMRTFLIVEKQKCILEQK